MEDWVLRGGGAELEGAPNLREHQKRGEEAQRLQGVRNAITMSCGLLAFCGSLWDTESGCGGGREQQGAGKEPSGQRRWQQRALHVRKPQRLPAPPANFHGAWPMSYHIPTSP